MMVLDSYSRILLVKARRSIERGDAQFICVTIDAYVSSSEEDHRIADELKAAIL
jgi:hypothetical protein